MFSGKYVPPNSSPIHVAPPKTKLNGIFIIRHSLPPQPAVEQVAPPKAPAIPATPPKTSTVPVAGLKPSPLLILANTEPSVTKRKRRTEVEMLRDDWAGLSYYKNLGHRPMLHEFGRTPPRCNGEPRHSQRIQRQLLITLG